MTRNNIIGSAAGIAFAVIMFHLLAHFHVGAQIPSNYFLVAALIAVAVIGLVQRARLRRKLAENSRR